MDERMKDGWLHFDGLWVWVWVEIGLGWDWVGTGFRVWFVFGWFDCELRLSLECVWLQIDVSFCCGLTVAFIVLYLCMFVCLSVWLSVCLSVCVGLPCFYAI